MATQTGISVGESRAALPLTSLSDEEAMFRDAVRRFARERIAPHVRAMDEAGAFRRDLLGEMFELGLMGVEIPEQYGGQGGSFFLAVLAVEAIAEVDPSAAVIVDVQNTIVNNVLLRWGTEAQKSKYLPRLAADTVAFVRLVGGGLGLGRLRAHDARGPRWRSFRLTGRKLWITNAAEAGIFLVFANANPEAGYKGITCFIVERDFAGFRVGKKEDKLGIRASSTCELILDDCRSPATNVLGEVGKGYRIAIETLNEGRIGIGAQMAGLAQGALRSCHRLMRNSASSSESPSRSSRACSSSWRDMAVDVEAARLMVYNAARMRDAGRPLSLRRRWPSCSLPRWPRRMASRAVEVLGRRWVYQGLSGREAVSRCQDRPHLRGHQQHADDYDCETDPWLRRGLEVTVHARKSSRGERRRSARAITCNRRTMRLSLCPPSVIPGAGFALADAATATGTAPAEHNLSQEQIDQIITKFAAKEAAFARARENYTYRQTVKVQELDESGDARRQLPGDHRHRFQPRRQAHRKGGVRAGQLAGAHHHDAGGH